MLEDGTILYFGDGSVFFSVNCISTRRSPSACLSVSPSNKPESAMASESAYSFSLTTFSPTGKLVQIEHALAAVHKGSAALGIQGTSYESLACCLLTFRRMHV